jgi:hypothetical protein
MTINELKIRLSFELWEDIFNDKKDDVDTIFNSFLNRYLQILYACFPKRKFYDRSQTKSWITTGIKVPCQRKRDLYLLTKVNNSITLKQFYTKYCKILSNVIKEAKRHKYNELIMKSHNKVKTIWKIIKAEMVIKEGVSS